MKAFFETSLQKLAKVLSKKYEVKVVHGGYQAYTDGKTIHLPSTKQLSEETVADLNALLDHEVAHCKFTDFSILKLLHLSDNPKFRKDLLNIAEDVRIERLMGGIYPGSKFNLAGLNNRLSEKWRTEWAEISWQRKLIFLTGLAMEGDLRGFSTEDVKLFWPIVERHLPTLNKANSTKILFTGCMELADELLLRIKEIEEEKEKRAEEKRAEEKRRAEEADETKADETKAEEADEEADEADEEAEEADEEAEEADEEAEEADEEADEEAEEADEEAEETKAEEAEEADDSEFDSEADSEFEGIDDFDTEDLDDFDDTQGTMTVDDMVNDKIQEETGDESSFEYMPTTTEFDQEIEHKGDPLAYNRLKAEVRPIVNPLLRKLEKMLVIRQNKRYRMERERGSLNTAHLARLASNKNYRTPFKELTQTEVDNVAIEILVDLSGSMYGDKIELAKQSAIALAESLKSLGIAYEVTGFEADSCYKLSRFVAKLKRNGERLGSRKEEVLINHVFKSFSDNKPFGISEMAASGNNIDGESVRWAASRLYSRTEKRKILMVLSDGYPASCDDLGLDQDLKDAIQEVEKSGIETIGLGIMSEAVEQFYPKSVVIKKLEDLPTVCMKELSKLLLK